MTPNEACLRAVLAEVQIYLDHNTDNLCGDDNISDGRLTMRFNGITGKIARAISSTAGASMQESTDLLAELSALRNVAKAAKNVAIMADWLSQGATFYRGELRDALTILEGE